MTTNDLRVGERMRHRGVVSHHSSPLLSDDFGVVVTRFPGSAVSVTPRPSVLVKGIAVSSRYVHPLAEQPAKCGEVVRIDLPGLGAAPGPKRDVSIPLNADVLCAFPQRAGVGNPMLAGHSIGTLVVTKFASDSPEISDRLVLSAQTVNPPDRREGTAATALVRGSSMESTRSPLNLAIDNLVTGCLARCGNRCFFAPVRFASLIANEPA